MPHWYITVCRAATGTILPRRLFQAQDVLSSLHAGVRGLRLAFAEMTFWDQADREVAQAVRACGDVFAGLGAQVSSIDFPEAAEAQALNPRGLVVAAEVYTLHQARIEAHFAAYDPIVSDT